MPTRDFDLTTTTEVLVLGSQCGGGRPSVIQLRAENVLLFAADNDSTVSLFDAFTTGDDIGSEANDHIWEAIAHLGRSAPEGETDDGTWYVVSLRWNLTDPGAPTYIHLAKVVDGAVVPGEYATWGGTGFRGAIAPSSGSGYPAYGELGWPIRYRVIVVYADPPVDDTPDPEADHLYPPTDLAVVFTPADDPDPAVATLTWTDGSDNEESFVVERRELTGDGVWYEMYRPDANVVTWADVEVLPGTTAAPEFQYRVYAVSATLRSTDSNIATLSIGEDGEEGTAGTIATVPIIDPGPVLAVLGPPPSTVTTDVIVVPGLRNGTLTYAWTQVSGPDGNATIATPTAVNTDLTFAAYVPGTYVFRLTVTTEPDLAGPSLVSTAEVTCVLAPTIAPRVRGGNAQV